MRLLALALFSLFLFSLCFSYTLSASREEMLNYYYSSIEGKLPKSARMLIGDERVNVYLGGQVVGLETMRGELYSFETSPVQAPTIVIRVSDSAMEGITSKKIGLLAAIETGEIQLEPKTFFSAVKIEMIKRIYAASGADRKLFGSGASGWQNGNYNSLYVQRTRIEN